MKIKHSYFVPAMAVLLLLVCFQKNANAQRGGISQWAADGYQYYATADNGDIVENKPAITIPPLPAQNTSA